MPRVLEELDLVNPLAGLVIDQYSGGSTKLLAILRNLLGRNTRGKLSLPWTCWTSTCTWTLPRGCGSIILVSDLASPPVPR